MDVSIVNKSVVVDVTSAEGIAVKITVQAVPDLVVGTLGLQGPMGANGSTEWPDLPSPDLVFENSLV